MIKQDVLFATIIETIRSIDSELKSVNNSGIFFAPELYIAFCMGRDIYKNRVSVFEDSNVQWLRETNLGNGGLTDIAFKGDSSNVVIEVKLIDTWHSYSRDIEKLKQLPKTHEKFFCVLIDKISGRNDGRIQNLKDKYQTDIIDVLQYSFPTWSTSSVDSCELNLFRIR